jgi:hypothetical protein
MHGTFKTRRRRKVSDAELVARRAYYLAHNAKLRTFLEWPQPTKDDKAAKPDAKRTKDLAAACMSAQRIHSLTPNFFKSDA